MPLSATNFRCLPPALLYANRRPTPDASGAVAASDSGYRSSSMVPALQYEARSELLSQRLSGSVSYHPATFVADLRADRESLILLQH